MPSSTTLAEALRSPIDYTEQIRLATPGANWRAPLSSFIRPVLAAIANYYVRTDGSDSNNGLSNTPGGAFLTIDKAMTTVAGLDNDGFNVNVNVADGTYSTIGAGGAVAAVLGPWVGSGTVTLIGNTTTPANCVISGGTSAGILLANYAKLSIKGFKITSSGGGYSVYSNYGSVASFTDKMEFGAGGFSILYATNFGHMEFGGVAITVSGGSNWFAAGDRGSIIIGSSAAFTMSGTPAFAVSTIGAYDPGTLMDFSGASFSGAATGSRYDTERGACIRSNGGSTTFFPGNAAGTGTNYSASPWGLYL